METPDIVICIFVRAGSLFNFIIVLVRNYAHRKIPMVVKYPNFFMTNLVLFIIKTNSTLNFFHNMKNPLLLWFNLAQLTPSSSSLNISASFFPGSSPGVDCNYLSEDCNLLEGLMWLMGQYFYGSLIFSTSVKMQLYRL